MADNKSSVKYKKIFLNIFLYYSKVIIFVVVIIILALGYKVLLSPKYKSIQENIKQVNENLTSDVKKGNKYIDNLREFNNVYRNIPESKKKQIYEYIPLGYNYKRELLFFEDFFQKLGIVKSSIEINNETNSGRYEGLGEIHLDASFENTDYNGVKEVLQYFESTRRIFDVTGISFGAGGSSLNIQFTAYYFKM